MENEKEFLSIIHKFIDSITSVNQSLGSNRELLASLLQKIDFQKEDNKNLEEIILAIQKDIESLKEASHKNEDLLDLFKAYLEKSMSSENEGISKEEIQLKIEQLRADKEERIENTKQTAAVKSERWKTIAAIITAAVTSVGVTFAAMKGSDKDKKEEKKVETTKETKDVKTK